MDSQAVSNGHVAIIKKTGENMRDHLKTTVLPLDKVVNHTQLLAFGLVTEKTQMMVQLTAGREFRNHLSVPISSNSSPAVQGASHR